MKISLFSFSTTRRFAAVAILASFVFSNVFAQSVLRGSHSNGMSKSSAMAKYTTDLTQLGREGRLRENLNFENETLRLIKVLAEGGIRQPVIVDEDKTAPETVVEQLAIRIGKGDVPPALAGKSIVKVETDVLFSNARTATAVAQILDSIVNDAVASKGQTILYINELTNFVGSRAATANLFKAVTEGKLNVIGGSSALVFDEQITSRPEIVAYFEGIVASDRSGVVAKNTDRGSEETEFRGDNISPDLREMMASDPSGATRIDVIIQAKDADNSALRSLMASGQARISDRIGNTETLVVNLPLSALDDLSTSGLINYISPDRQIGAAGHIETTTGATQMRSQAKGYGRTAAYTLDGTGVGIAILDSGIYASQRAFLDGTAGRLAFSKSFVSGVTSTDDDFGHGTHVASLAVGSSSRNTNAYRGIAYNAKIINLKVLDGTGVGTTSALLSAMDWILANKATYHIRVANMSVGTPAIDTWTNDPLCRKAQSLNAAGILVVTAAGNNGQDTYGQKMYGMIHSPGNDPSVLTVGASNSMGTDARGDDIMSTFSSNGPTRSGYTNGSGALVYDNAIKPDVVAPGNNIVGAKAKDSCYLYTQKPSLMEPAMDLAGDTNDVMYLSGTSMSTGIVSGAAALLFQMNPKLTPTMAKMLLMYSAQLFSGKNMLEQGAGQLNIDGAVVLGRNFKFTTDFNTYTPGTTLMQTGLAVPTATSAISGTTFPWAQGIMTNNTYLKGVNMANTFQSSYKNGFWFESGVSYSAGVPSLNSNYGTGITMNKNVMASNATAMGGGTVFLSTSALLGLATDGSALGTGTLTSDRSGRSTGVLVGDSDRAQAASLLVGDNTPKMH
jgi:subtilisin family serine protease